MAPAIAAILTDRPNLGRHQRGSRRASSNRIADATRGCQLERPAAIRGASPADRSLFRGYRCPPKVIGQAGWLYFRFHLSFCDAQDLSPTAA
jgi:hypothetical protein